MVTVVKNVLDFDSYNKDLNKAVVEFYRNMAFLSTRTPLVSH